MNQSTSLRDQYQRDSSLIGSEILPQLDLVCEQHWTEDEKSKFKEALKEHGKDFKKIAKAIPTRNQEQVRS